MNWYIKNIFAQTTGLQNYLESLGATPDIVQYISSLDSNIGQILTNEFRKNPSLTLEQLQQLQQNRFPQKQQVDPYLPFEKKLAKNFELELPQFAKWVLVSYRKLRRGLFWTDNNGNKIIPYGNESPLSDQESTMYQNFSGKLREIADWYGSVRPDISLYSPQEAAIASDEWHKMMAGQGEGVEYEPTKSESVVYGPKWENSEWEGWTIQKVIGRNDLIAEGNKMDHCVGSFCEGVERQNSSIYSLRDPKNNPHVTIEIGGEKGYTPGSIKQIQGKSNSDPKDEYKEMIKEWISTSGEKQGINKEINTFEFMEEQYAYDSPSVLEITTAIEKILQGEKNEYGLKYIFDSNMETVIDKLVTEGEAENKNYRRRDSEYYGDIANSPSYVVNLALMQDLALSYWPRHSEEYQAMREMSKQSNWKNIQEVEQWAWETLDELTEEFHSYETGLEYPQEEGYEDSKEFEEAMKEFEEAESEIYDEWARSSVKGGFAKDLLDNLESFRKENIIPKSQELYEIKLKEQAQLQEESEKRQFSETSTASSMNWYKKYIYARISPTSKIDFLNKLKMFGIMRGRNAAGSHTMYINPYLNKQSPIPIGKDGENLKNGLDKKIIDELGIPWSIWKKLPPKPRRKEVKEIENQLPWFKLRTQKIEELKEPEKQKIPDYKKSIWFQNQQRQMQEEEKLQHI